MVPYFKELENPNDQFILLTTRRSQKVYMVDERIPEDCYDMIATLFKKIESYDLLYDRGLPKVPYIEEGDYDFTCEGYSNYINNHKPGSGLTLYGVAMIDRLKDEYQKSYVGDDFDEAFYAYFSLITEYISKPLFKNKTELIGQICRARELAKYQNKLTVEDNKLFNNVLKRLNSMDRVEKQDEYISDEYPLPNSWFITPFNHLYNSMGPHGHKETNLVYPYADIQGEYRLEDENEYLKKIDTILKEGRIQWCDFYWFIHIKNDPVSILPTITNYYDDGYIYDSKVVNLVVGVFSAHAGLFRFFNDLKKNSKDYRADLDYLKQFTLDEVLVRCCGFHKIISVESKTITTSDLDYKETLKEYIDRGWRIDFQPPIKLDYYGRLHIDDDFSKIYQVLKEW